MEALLKNFLNKYRTPIGIFLVTVVLVGGGVLALTTGRSKPSGIEKVVVTDSSPSELNETTASSTPVPIATIKIDVSGAVVNPGVYELPEGDRVENALNAAGGLAEGADREWVAKNLNLATKLSDGGKLYIPKAGEISATPNASAPVVTPPATAEPASGGGVVSGTKASSTPDCSRVNINTASAGTLDECLSGIGTIKAQSIIKYREDRGGFKSIEEIKNVSGIAEGTFAKIKDQITVD